MRGGDTEEVKEIALDMLKPYNQPEVLEKPDQPITAELIAEIWQALINLRKSKKGLNSTK
jgi:hypothetical protein